MGRAKPTRIMVCPDAHHPYVDELAWKTFLAAARVAKPDIMVIIGDFADCYAVSSHAKDPGRKSKLKYELEMVNLALDQIEELGISRVEFCEGNHETRITRFVASEASALYGMLDVSELLRIEARGWGWTPYNDFLKIGKVLYTHDVGRCGVNTARQSLQDMGTNIVVGHSHRAALVFQGTTAGEQHFGLNVGWLGDLNSIDYQHKARARRDWQHAFGLIDQTPDGCAWATLVPILDGHCVVYGQPVNGRSRSR